MAVCETCSEMVKFLGNIWQTSRELGEDTVPEEWSSRAEQILGDQALSPIRELPVLAAALTFDSFNALAAESVRSSSLPTVRHIIYTAPQCSVELKIDQGSERRAVSIVGQIVDSRNPNRAIEGTPVFLLTGTKVLASTVSNQFGEFQLSCKAKRRMLISFPFDGSRVNVSLDRLF